MSRTRAARALAFALATAAPVPVAAETLVAALSRDRVSIESNFTGTEVTVFGTIEADPNDPPRPRGWDVVVSLTGPRRAVVVRRKEPVAGLWINRESLVIADVPLFAAVASTLPLDRVTDAATAARLGLGRAGFAGTVTEAADARTAAFRLALHRLQSSNGRWAEQPTGVTFLGRRLFSATLPIPADVPIGPYRARVTLFADGRPLADQTLDLIVAKSGFEQGVADLATHRPILYGLLAVAMALVTGWLGGVLFRRD
ncbi:hypothetical protein EYW49_11815 [Siculibacillus lacustris]|uniref:TIGR02186 family protein n=1 Tax=Siculibacillus lacustris TaxID=1549641 RepID=A0A4Q9VND2_9HYPH|nr:TIGR02186 family protein [Siculibacillus lacustris]TBW37151.1 hypothetical protein EYW49_11815 [Siculibacillus lacustris]